MLFPHAMDPWLHRFRKHLISVIEYTGAHFPCYEPLTASQSHTPGEPFFFSPFLFFFPFIPEGKQNEYVMAGGKNKEAQRTKTSL